MPDIAPHTLYAMRRVAACVVAGCGNVVASTLAV